MTIDDDDVNRGQLIITETVSRSEMSLVIEGKSRRHPIEIVVRAIRYFVMYVTCVENVCKHTTDAMLPLELPAVIGKTSILLD